MPALMLQGTGSNVGKSLLVAGLCRAAHKRGLNVRPFKPQNMSNNAAVTIDGGEIGRAQALQALACGVEPHTDMNPVLLKPESEKGAAIILHGRHIATLKARDYAAQKPELLQQVLQSFNRLKASSDLVIVEGAGSPAEVNLRAGDIANMGFAEAVNLPVVLIGDIDRGGVIAQIIGTKAVLPPTDLSHIKGFIINKFCGDPTLFDDGYRFIEEQTNWRGFGVLPYFANHHSLPAEDALDIKTSHHQGAFKIACLRLDRIANFDDLDPLAMDQNLNIEMIEPGQPISGDAHLVIIPGSKSTISDLQKLRQNGWHIDLAAHIRRGGHVLGICGGYQMLGTQIFDPEHIEGTQDSIEGLGLLDVTTTMKPQKSLKLIHAVHATSGHQIRGYEIHIGETTGQDRARPFAFIDGEGEGAISKNGQVMGTYLHGGFAEDGFRQAFLESLGASASDFNYDENVTQTLDALANHIETHLDVEALLALAHQG